MNSLPKNTLWLNGSQVEVRLPMQWEHRIEEAIGWMFLPLKPLALYEGG